MEHETCSLWRISMLLFGLLTAVGFGKPVFEEKRGLVVMEAESTFSRLGDWKKKTDVEGYAGECHLEFTGNRTISGPPKSPLKYRFKISREGNYTLMLRARKRLETKREDISNDCYVSLKGDFEAGGKAPLKVLKNDTKMFGGKPDGWGWATSLDANHKKFPPVYRLKSGEEYELTIHGRSKNFNLDRIMLFHDSHKRGEVQRRKLKESGLVEEGASALPARVKRKLTNQDGRSTEAELVELDGETIVVIIKGRLHRIDVSTLVAEDQVFISRWWSGEE